MYLSFTWVCTDFSLKFPHAIFPNNTKNPTNAFISLQLGLNHLNLFNGATFLQAAWKTQQKNGLFSRDPCSGLSVYHKSSTKLGRSSTTTLNNQVFNNTFSNCIWAFFWFPEKKTPKKYPAKPTKKCNKHKHHWLKVQNLLRIKTSRPKQNRPSASSSTKWVTSKNENRELSFWGPTHRLWNTQPASTDSSQPQKLLK